MIAKVNLADVPPSNKPRSPIRQFALDSLTEFFGAAQKGEVFEVTGFPGSAEQMVDAARAESHYLTRARAVRAFRRRGRVFLEALESGPRIYGPDGRRL